MNRLIGGVKTYEVIEFVYWAEWKYTPHELVLLNIIIDFERHGKSNILNEKTLRCGFAYGGHQKFGNMY